MTTRTWRYLVVISKQPVVSYWLEIVSINGEWCTYDSYLWFQNGDIESRKKGQATRVSDVISEIRGGHLEVAA